MIVQVDSVTFRYGARVALNAVSFDVAAGATFALLGPNGSGKTTLFRILATLLSPAAGTASVGGFDVVRRRSRVREMIGVVFQRPGLDGKLTVRENLHHHGLLYGLHGGELKRRADHLLDRFGLTGRGPDPVETLSGGLQRRVELAKALLHGPKVLILDEPSTGLDPGARQVLAEYLSELRDRDGVTSLLTTHLIDEAERCDCVGILDQGTLLALDAPAVLKRIIGGDVVTVRTKDSPSLARRIEQRFEIAARVVNGTVRVERERGHAFAAELIETFGEAIESVTVGRPTLEDVFVRLTGHRLWEPADNVETAGAAVRTQD